MPIVVKHGDSLGNAGAIIAGALSAEADRKNKRAMQWQELKVQGAMASARAQSQIEAAEVRSKANLHEAAMKLGFAEEARRDEYEQKLNQAREKAKLDASAFEYKYTAKQRIEDAKYAKAEQYIRNSEQFSPEEKQAALGRLSVARAGIREPTEILGDPNKPKYPEGREPGQVWEGDGKAQGWLFSTNPDGTVDLQGRADQTSEYMVQQKEYDFKEKQLELETKHAETIAEKRLELLTTPVESTDPANPSLRYRTPEEVDKLLGAAYQTNAGQPQTPWWEDLQQKGYNVEEEDTQFPEKVGGSRAYLRTMKQRYGSFEGIPTELRASVEAAARVVKAYGNR